MVKPPPRRPPRCGLRQPPRSPTQKLVATNRRPRVPLAASGGVGGRARGRGRLADAAANWWADPESPRKRGRLSAVRQARLCGSGSPLLQHSPWQSQNLSAQPNPSAARRRHCSSRPLRLRPPFPWLICLKLPKISAPLVPAAAGEYLPVVGAICATLARAEGWRAAGLAECGAAAAPTRAGSRSAADALRRPCDRQLPGRLLDPAARRRAGSGTCGLLRSEAKPLWRLVPTLVTFFSLSFSAFIFLRGEGRGGVDGRREDPVD